MFQNILGKVWGSKQDAAGPQSSPSASSDKLDSLYEAPSQEDAYEHISVSSSVKHNPDEIDVIIVGGGIVGASLSAVLGADGRRVVMIERDMREPDRIVGELLQPGGVRKLQDLGLGDCLNYIDSPNIKGYSVFLEDEKVRLAYAQDQPTRVVGRSFHHGRFVQRLRAAAAKQPTVEIRECTVVDLIADADVSIVHGVKVKNNGSTEVTEIRAPLTIVCDGSGSLLRKSLSSAKPQVRSHFVGILMEDCAESIPFPCHGHVFLASPSPVLCYPISSSDVRVLVDVPGASLSAVGSVSDYLKLKIAPQLPAEVQTPFLAAVEKGRLRSMPNREMSGLPIRARGAILLGDAFNCRHPLTGGGMTVAFSDVTIIRDQLRKIQPEVSLASSLDVVEQLVNEFYELRKPMAATINILAGALYSVFAAQDDPALPYMRRACFDYFKLGGVAVSGPVSLLSGMNPNVYSLITHFFAVALYGVGKTICPFPAPNRISRAFGILRAATNIVKPLMHREQVLTWFSSIGEGPLDQCTSSCSY